MFEVPLIAPLIQEHLRSSILIQGESFSKNEEILEVNIIKAYSSKKTEELFHNYYLHTTRTRSRTFRLHVMTCGPFYSE